MVIELWWVILLNMVIDLWRAMRLEKVVGNEVGISRIWGPLETRGANHVFALAPGSQRKKLVFRLGK